MVDCERRYTACYRDLRPVHILEIIGLSVNGNRPVKDAAVFLGTEDRCCVDVIFRCYDNSLLLVVCALVAHCVSAILVGSDACDGTSGHDCRKHVDLRGQRLQLGLDLGQLVV